MRQTGCDTLREVGTDMWKLLSIQTGRTARLAILVLALLLAGCSASSAQGKRPHTSATPTARHALATASATASAAGDTPMAQPQHMEYKGNGLYIETTLSCREYAVLATNRTTYDVGEIRALTDYTNSIQLYTDDENGDVVTLLPTIPEGPTPKPPSTLALATGGPCEAHIEITNTGSSTAIVERAGARLLADPRPNLYSYRLIDLCSMGHGGSNGYCNAYYGGGPECDTYSATIPLSNGSVGTIYSAEPISSDPTDCPAQMNVPPGSSAVILDEAFSASNQIFSVALQLTVMTSDGEKTLTLSQPSSPLIFAADTQFTCYALQGATFVVESKGADALINEIPHPHLCL